jgi:hypothetical protein
VGSGRCIVTFSRHLLRRDRDSLIEFSIGLREY